jgi:hypothetical protein
MKNNEEKVSLRFAREEFLWLEISQGVFSLIEEDYGPLDEKYQLFVSTCEAVINREDFAYSKWKGNGRPRNDRLSIAKAFLYKATFNIPTTKELVRQLRAEPMARRLCGWSSAGQIPSEAGFCVANREFAERGFTDKWFEAVVVKNHGGVHVDAVCYDSAPIKVRTKAANLKKVLAELDPDQPDPPNDRLERQFVQDAATSLAELPTECEWGRKMDAQGKKMQWKGGKCHMAVTQDGFPVAFKYTSASLHDSQVMIPLAKQAMARVGHYFDLADAAYDAKLIRATSTELGAVPVIDRNRRNSEESPNSMTETEAMVYKWRTAVERFFSHLLESHGGRTVRVREPAKVAQHLMYGILVIAVEQLMRMTC